MPISTISLLNLVLFLFENENHYGNHLQGIVFIDISQCLSPPIRGEGHAPVVISNKKDVIHRVIFPQRRRWLLLQFHTEVLPELPVTPHEETYWLLQQQQPEQVVKRVAQWQLDDEIDISLLALSLESLIRAQPDLNARYCFSEEGELYKFRVDGWYPCLEFRRMAARDVTPAVRALQYEPWDSVRQPPLKALIINTEHGVELVLIQHPVLDMHGSPETLMTALKKHYGRLSASLAKPASRAPLSSNMLPPVAPVAPVAQQDISWIILGEFRRALSSPEMGLDDDFFDHGGHSLLATRIIGKLLNEHGIECRFNDFFESPTANALACKAVRSDMIAAAGLRPQNNTGPARSPWPRPLCGGLMKPTTLAPFLIFPLPSTLSMRWTSPCLPKPLPILSSATPVCGPCL
ncbi:phosphopantetheine-binding protein [Aeromonas hydrophila]|uniref:acyl carrier protein n=1 Tax=Aeromonas hydrophila TaxID=644 RepID=UPI003EC6A029